eukprot:15478559-Alexandrium_andersonii.AAC.1
MCIRDRCLVGPTTGADARTLVALLALARACPPFATEHSGRVRLTQWRRRSCRHEHRRWGGAPCHVLGTKMRS